MKFEVEAELYSNYLGDEVPHSTSSTVVAEYVFDDHYGVFTVTASNYESVVIALLSAVDDVDSNQIFWLTKHPMWVGGMKAYNINPSSGIPERVEDDW